MRSQVSSKEVVRIVKYLCEKASPNQADVIRFTGARLLGISVENFNRYQKTLEEQNECK